MGRSDAREASTKSVVISVLMLRYHSSDTIKRNHRPHYDRPVMFFGGGFGRRLPLTQTRFCDVIEKLPESAWGVATASSLFLHISVICLKFAITLVSLLSVQISLF